MEENTFWLRLWGLGTIVLVAAIASCTAVSYNRLAKWETAVAGGADPLVASCALLDKIESERMICALVATDRK